MSTTHRDLEIEIPDDIVSSIPFVPITKDRYNLATLDDTQCNRSASTQQITTIVKETQTTAFGFSDDFTLDSPHNFNESPSTDNKVTKNLQKR